MQTHPQTTHDAVLSNVGFSTAIPAVRYSFFEALRRIENSFQHKPRIGHALTPAEESHVVSQPADLGFAPSTVSQIRSTSSGQVEVEQRAFGLLGPAGPLPLHLTELVRQRSRQNHDEALQAFLDLFHHRMATLFYRAWSSAQPSVQRDRPNEDGFARIVGSIVGHDSVYRSINDPQLSESQQYFAAHFQSHHATVEGLASIVELLLGSPSTVRPFQLRWLSLSKDDQSSLGCRNKKSHRTATAVLGRSTVLGKRVPDRESGLEVEVGPMSYGQFAELLPGKPKRQFITKIVKQHVGPTIDARIRLVLSAKQVPRPRIGMFGSLGRDCWLQSRPLNRDARDYVFDLDKSSTSSQRSHRS